MVVADSHGISRAPSYSGTTIWRPPCFVYGGLTHYARPSQTFRLHASFLTPRPLNSEGTHRPTTPDAQRLSAITHTRFSLLRFRSPLLTEYLLLRVLRCFTSPRSPHHPMNSGNGDQAQPQPGSPIRTPSDQLSLANSPRHFAGRNVLHQLLVPRHPPNAQQN